MKKQVAMPQWKNNFAALCQSLQASLNTGFQQRTPSARSKAAVSNSGKPMMPE
jgi:hypothetical protein